MFITDLHCVVLSLYSPTGAVAIRTHIPIVDQKNRNGYRMGLSVEEARVIPVVVSLANVGQPEKKEREQTQTLTNHTGKLHFHERFLAGFFDLDRRTLLCKNGQYCHTSSSPVIF